MLTAYDRVRSGINHDNAKDPTLGSKLLSLYYYLVLNYITKKVHKYTTHQCH